MISVVHRGLINDCAAPFNEVVDLHILLGALLIGAGVGFLSGAFGKGGSAVSTPLLHALGVPAIVAIASPLPATIPVDAAREPRATPAPGHVDRTVLRIGLIVGLPLTALGAFLTRWIAGEPLVLATDAILLVLGMRVLLGAHTSAHADETESRPTTRTRCRDRAPSAWSPSRPWCRDCSATAAGSSSLRSS